MPQTLFKRTSQRAAAVVALEKIKKTMEEVAQCSEETKKIAKPSVCHMEDFEILPQGSKKRKESLQDLSFEEILDLESDHDMGSNKSAKKHKSGDSATSNEITYSSSPQENSFASSLYDREPTAAELEEADRELRAAARRQQSGNRMMISRRLSYHIYDSSSPMYSPLAACKLWFSPSESIQPIRSKMRHNYGCDWIRPL
jgi:hypothetical protein